MGPQEGDVSKWRFFPREQVSDVVLKGLVGKADGIVAQN